MLVDAGSLPAGPTAPEQPERATLLARLLAMFTGEGEAPRASGLLAVCADTASGLCIDVNDVVAKAMGTPKAPGPHRAEMIRCCGQLDKEEARGWLVNDAIGRPLLHRNDERGQNSAREVGKRVANAASAAESAIRAAKAAASTAKSKAKAAAAKDPSQLPHVAAAAAAGEAAVAALRAEVVDLALPAITVGPARSTTEASVLREAAEKQAVLHRAAADLAQAEERLAALTTASDLAQEKFEKDQPAMLVSVAQRPRENPDHARYLRLLGAWKQAHADKRLALRTFFAAMDHHEQARLGLGHAIAALERYITPASAELERARGDRPS